jgi:asparagine synthase (glutamine-hydrolysing)
MQAFTFSMRDDQDEVASARRIADAVGAAHTVVDTDNAADYSGLYDAVACMDLPVGDAIILPTYQLCQTASRDLKVVLTGEGADEIFGGYVHFGAFDKLARLRTALPFADRLAPLIRLAPVALLDRYFDYQASLGAQGRLKLSRMIASLHEERAIYRLASSVIDDHDIVEATNLRAPPVAQEIDLSLAGAMLETVQTWLPYQILNKMDQLSMAHGLEARVPFLDPRLYEHMAGAPDELILANGENKILLRRVLQRQGGDWKRPKLAFHVPMEKRYRAALQRLCRDWLSGDEIRKHGILNESYVQENLRYLGDGDFLASKRLVTMASLHMWLDAHGTVH